MLLKSVIPGSADRAAVGGVGPTWRLWKLAGMTDNGHILLVDDQREICDLVQEYLSGEGYRVSTAQDGAEMRRVMAQSPVDLVILDLMLPGEDGLTLARSLRQESSVGIIILTGRGEIVDRIIGLEMGADDYLPKPFHLRELLARVKSVLRRASSRDDERQAAPRSRARFSGWNLDLASRVRKQRQPGADPRSTARSRPQSRSRAVRPNDRRPGRAASQEARGRSAKAGDDQNRARQRLYLHPDSRGDLRRTPRGSRTRIRRLLLTPSDSCALPPRPYPRGGQRPRPHHVA